MIATMGGGFLIGHTALAFLMPLTLVALWFGYRRHGDAIPLVIAGIAVAIGYIHIFGGTPEWTLYGVMLLSFVAAAVDWRVGRVCAVKPPAVALGPAARA